ncbi:MAG TPA: AAA family ATPase [Streptosporangiaceae bacterium]|nr:AAA family ATPase [Streptosporangiaceae bacterium]
MHADRTPLRGRDPERSVIRDLLGRAQRGAGGVVLVEGEPGIGKSRLLRDACQEAGDRAFSLVAGAADPLAHAIPHFTLRAALHEPLTGPAASHDCPEAPSQAYQLGRIRSRLEERAASAPLLICLDDLHCEGEGTLAALRSLQRDLCRRPLAWLLARSNTVRCGADHLFALLERDGAVRITLGPLAQDAAEMMLADAFGAPPDPRLTALAQDAAGIPALLTELISSLREDRAVEVSGGRSVLASHHLPPQFREVAQRRLRQVSRQTRHLLITAAVLGPAFRLEDAAEMLGESPASLLPAIEEAIDAALVSTAGHGFSFRNELLRRAAGDMIPAPARAAIHRQYAEILLGRGASATDAASHLLQASRPDDPASLPSLDRAAARTIRSAPQVAADLAVQALRLTRPGDPAELSRSVTAAEALAAAGRLEQAQRIAEATRARPLPQMAEFRLRCVMSWVLCTRGQPHDAAAEAAVVLGAAQLPRGLRARAQAASLQALTGMPAEHTAGTGFAPDVRPGSGAAAAALILQASRCWDSGQVRESLELMRDAARGSSISMDARDAQPLLALAATLADMRKLDDAEAILGAAAASDVGDLPAGAAVALLRSRIHLAAGRLGAAGAEAGAALDHAQTLAADSYAAAARSVLAVIELRRGHVGTAASHIGSRPLSGLHSASIYARSESSLAQAQVVEASDGPPAALRCLAAFCAELPARPGTLLADPAAAAWLARAALAAGEEKLAAVAAEAATTVAAANPAFLASSAAAAHALGLLHRDSGSLASAAREHADPWARASAAEDLGVLQELRDERQEAVDSLTSALAEYKQVGASRDEARVRSRLRQLGVRRRHWTTSSGDRAVSGWHSLTATERAVACLVAEGLNNNQVAARMYISTHTVAYHLRQAFRRLDISSRVELARIVIEQAAGGTPAG